MAQRKYNINTQVSINKVSPPLSDAVGKIVSEMSIGQPGGNDITFQYNNAGVFAGLAGMTTDGTDVTISTDLFVPLTPATNASAASKQYVDNASGASPGGSDGNIQFNNNGAFGGVSSLSSDVAGTTITLSALGTVNTSLGTLIVKQLPTADGHAASKKYVDDNAAVGGSNTQLQYNNSGTFAGITGATTDGTTLTIPTGNVLTITDAPTADTDAINKLYVDTIAVPNTDATNALQFNDSGDFGSVSGFQTSDGINLNIITGGTLTAENGASISCLNGSTLDVRGDATFNGTSVLTIETGASATIADAPTADTDIANKAYVDASGGGGSDVTWMLSSSVFSAPVFAYTIGTVDVNATGIIEPTILDGTIPVVSWSETGLPTEFSLNTSTGVITYTTTAAASSGTATITATTPVGSSNFEFAWAIQAAQGALQFLNTLNPYPFLSISVGNSVSTQYLIKNIFFGTIASASSGVLTADAAYPIYVADNGDGTWNYFIKPSSYTYWNFYSNLSFDPVNMAAGQDIFTGTASISYSLVSPATQDITLNSVEYPSDRTDIHWGSQLNYIDFGADSSLDGFMAADTSWSYGFRLPAEGWQRDGMGRSLFNRQGRNYLAFALGHTDTYSNLIFGNGASRTYDSDEDSVIPVGGFPGLAFVRFTYDSSALNMYVNGVLYYSTTSLFFYFDDAASANGLNLQWGNSVLANDTTDFYDYLHTKWQGLITRLWISNGIVATTDDDGTTFPTGTTNSWLLDEITGNGFAATDGSIAGTGTATTSGGASARIYTVPVPGSRLN